MFPFCSDPQRGVSRSSRTRAGVRWTRPRRKACGESAYGQAVWSCPLDAGVKLIEMINERRRLTSPTLRGEHGAAVKTIAQGVPDRFGFTCSDYARLPVLFLQTRLRVRPAPGIPCALAFQGPANDASPGRFSRRGNAGMRLRAGGMVDLSVPSNQNKFARNDGRSGRIRTCDPCFPKAVLYRAEPHSD
jgi:hypothetical protein